jgi:N-acetylglucosaminyldiphosphoundecaprenol N-acetyl-beta-D-mannosaminyltransferase
LNPALRVAGDYDGEVTESSMPEILARLRRVAPDLIWVGLGTPRQQMLISWLKPRLQSGVLLSVGFAFEVNAGTKPDAPPWMHRCGLTWFFRLLSEPLRLGPRYAKYNTLFIYYLARDRLPGRPSTS